MNSSRRKAELRRAFRVTLDAFCMAAGVAVGSEYGDGHVAVGYRLDGINPMWEIKMRGCRESEIEKSLYNVRTASIFLPALHFALE